MSRIISFRAPETMAKRLYDLSFTEGISLSAVICELLEESLEDMEEIEPADKDGAEYGAVDEDED